MDKKYYVEYSIIQKCFHIDTLEAIKKVNLSLCARNISNGYVVIAGPFTMEEACEYSDKIKDDWRNKLGINFIRHRNLRGKCKNKEGMK